VARWDAAWHRRLREILADLPNRPPEEASAVRRKLAERDVIAFAIIYLEKHLRSPETGDQVTFAECHYEWARQAETWADPATEPMQHRDAYIAPRATGKTTWFFLILPLWAAAFGHVRFCAAFSQASSQAEGHLSTMKTELDSNPLLRFDFPLLCTPARRQSGSTVADRQGMIHTKSRATFAARGMDSAILGLKVGEVRPGVLIIDDGEPDEAQYSPGQARKRLGTLVDAIFALNVYARVIMVGTVTMPGSIMHQLVRHAVGDVDETNEWVADEKIRVHHHRPILTGDDGTERSIWPQKWSLTWLRSRRRTREYRKNYDNDPGAVDGGYWTSDDFRYGTLGPLATRWILNIDPAVTTKGTSDWTGLAVVGCRPPVVVRRLPGVSAQAAIRAAAEQAHADGLPEWMDPFARQCEVAKAWMVKLAGEKLRREVLRTLNEFPRIRVVRIEVNQGGELWETILHDLPPGVRLVVHTSTVGKEIRFSEALSYYQLRQVLHRERFPVMEDQMTGFPRAQWDDLADAASSAELFFLRPGRGKKQSRATVSSYRR
jgi:hypothetical protein